MDQHETDFDPGPKPSPHIVVLTMLFESVERLTEAVVRLADAGEAFCLAFDDLPAVGHVKYEERFGVAVGTYRTRLVEARGTLLVGGK